ncbi:hypothetical protein EX895_005462 [Sporisorium graminicola]|uniref:Feruloyl esterase n=1 Tax=Sporisorium graminicola TaxID=280036 RepID=A0A4U7KM32_9BASI|nr:hypothetical protein EX895_005462 [Sporisorium graminicola]TKY85300.1 hypothetical protein EX895_005462 [Sporisorium graminicola]
MRQRHFGLNGTFVVLWLTLAFQLGKQVAIGSVLPSTDGFLTKRLGGVPIWKSPVCFSPAHSSPYESAVTTVQTGTDCTKYGDPPAKVLSDFESPDGLLDVIDVCHGEIVTMADNLGYKRRFCFFANPKSTEEKPLPLLVWLHPSLLTATLSFPMSGIDAVRDTQSLNNEDPSRLGFSYIVPAGRNIVHHYLEPNHQGLGWDNWYRNLDRSSPSLNADVDLIDKAITYAKDHISVDQRRVFMSGWSNGGSLSELYAANTDGIAAAAVYSAPDPYRDSQDPCAQVPHPKYATPVRDVHNSCDIVGTCTTGLYYFNDLKKRYASLPQSIVVIDDVTAAIKGKDGSASCDPDCQGPCETPEGLLAHTRYPISRNDDTIFAFLRSNPLPASGTWGPPQ